MVKLLMLARQKRSLEQDLIIIIVRTGPIEKNVKYHSNIFMNIMKKHSHNGIDDWQFTLIEQCETHEQLKARETFWQHRLKTSYPYGLNEKKEYLYYVIFPDIPLIRHTIFQSF